ncbi:DUF4437 domain-containing protein [Winogradskyella flava]|uniref:DUF4437 domain-containing protein n=1 Tax=Winogradskyella flava TaxID=1884876 RepID=A0A842IUH3_9FLAO|nr:DUF4437 domain-containing protein [Winogradskyella flava]MBC2846720.1 DUF4437 domain-containing protein [Winogradskyella flava]
MKQNTDILLLMICLVLSCSNKKEQTNLNINGQIISPTNAVVLSSEIQWEKLNPARGDQSPQAGTIWGDRKGEVATGFLAKFVDGFSSPPHIHNVTYRAVVLKGQIHNDDAEAENMWMGTGSFWTQPKGEAHITSAKGKENIAYVEIDKGPYLVKPIDEAFDDGEKPMNLDASNIVWLGANKTNLIKSKSKAEISFLWENEGLQGLFIKLQSGFNGAIESDGSVFRAVVIDGELNYELPQDNDAKSLSVGSSFSSSDKAIHKITNNKGTSVLIYIRTNGTFKVK